jgi:flavodoxin
MKAMVVYDSVFGNTGQIGQAIGDALGSQAEVETRQVSEVKPEQLAGLDVLVVGSPTRQFKPTPATTSLLKGIPKDGLDGVKVAAFDTRFTESNIAEAPAILGFFVRIFGYAAEPIAGRLEKKGGELVLPPEGFYVGDTEGPLLEGELERAAAWANQILA